MVERVAIDLSTGIIRVQRTLAAARLDQATGRTLLCFFVSFCLFCVAVVLLLVTVLLS